MLSSPSGTPPTAGGAPDQLVESSGIQGFGVYLVLSGSRYSFVSNLGGALLGFQIARNKDYLGP